MKFITKSIKILSILFLGIGLHSCEEDDVILPEVIAEFTYTVNQETGVVTFLNTSENANIYMWDFGDSESSTEVNPSHLYQPGTYEVVLSARNIASPYKTFSSSITIDGSDPGTGGNCTEETEESIDAADLNITFQTNTPAIIEDNTTFSWIDNPDSEGSVYTSCKVGEVVRANNSPFDNIQIDLADKLDFNASEGIKMKVWSPIANTPVLLKLEEIGNSGNFVELSQSTGDANTWTELTYDFAATASPQFDKMVIFFNFNVADGSTYYFDDLALYGAGGGGSGCVAETTESIAAADLNITFQTNTPTIIEDNTAFSWIDNPDSGGTVNTSCKVGEVVRANNSPYDNIQIDLADKLDFNSAEGLKMKVWSPIANTPVLLKLEEIGNAGNFVEILQTTGDANTWTELTYDFAPTTAPQFNKLVVFFNFNVADGSTYYFDDLMVYGAGGGGSTCVPETTESTTAADLNVTFQTNTPPIIEDNTAFSWIDNPDFGGTVNTSCKVGQVDRFNNSPYDNIQIDLADKLDFNASEGLKMKVWSPIANTPVLLKIEEIGNAGNFVEILQTTGAANTWTELTYDFAPTATPQFNKIVLFFNFNVADGSTYYFDDLMVYGTGGGAGGGGGGCTGAAVGATAFPVDFESCESFTSTFNDSGSITTELADNPAMTGINTSDYVLKVVKEAGTNRWAGFQNPFPNNFDATQTFKFKIYSSKANVVMRFEVNSDPQSPDSGNPGPQFATITNANTWTEVEINFTGIPPSNTGLNQLVIKPDNPDGTDGEVTSSSETYYFDDIRLE
ncbi:MAG: PKD domain-containing protein [Bacteroidia bacterium]|nr:PKD domain-containing protein [Bacteroidia bacterium]